MKTSILAVRVVTLSSLVLYPLTTQAQSDEELPVLETFIAEESASALTDTVLPTDREISGLFNDTTSILEVPRSLTLLSPEIMDQFNVNDLRDLEKFGAGTQAINYYGVPGTPTIRGVKGGTYLNGMLRAYNRNEMPLSFGSLEAIEVVKGPAPADFSPTLVGGFVNLIPKSPYFDELQGSLELEVDNWGRITFTGDYGQPILLPGDIPAAYRVSITTQDGESYYDNLRNDFTSVYGSVKLRPADGLSVFVGGEYFDFRSNENPGWNRPTQQLIDSNLYVIGEPVNAVAARSRFVADRDALGSPALSLERSVAERLVPQFGNLADMTLITDTDGVEKYVYTQAYFDNGGRAVTQEIDGSTVLTDSSDFADSTSFVLFGDIIFDADPDRTFTLKFLAEDLTTEKLSSYGYAFESEQTVGTVKAFVTERALIPFTTITAGGSLRYTDAKQLQDFWSEPFSRRDITSQPISANSRILAGGQTTTDGVSYWNGGFGGVGGNAESELWQGAVFISGVVSLIDERLDLSASFRAEIAEYDLSLPEEADLSDTDVGDREEQSDSTDYFNWTLGANFEVVPGVFIYGTYQEGQSVDPLQGGPIVGEGSFSENELWEAGVKVGLLDNKLYATFSVYEWQQSAFDIFDNSSELLEGEGVEVEFTYQVTEDLTIIGSYTWQEVRRNLPEGATGFDDFRTIPFTEQDWALYGGELNSNFGAGSFDGRDRSALSNLENNPDLIYPGTPQTVIKLFAIYEVFEGLTVGGGGHWQEEFWQNIDRTIELPDALVLSLNATYSTDSYEFGVGVENLLDEEYFLGADPIFAANTLTAKAPERTFVFRGAFKF